MSNPRSPQEEALSRGTVSSTPLHVGQQMAPSCGVEEVAGAGLTQGSASDVLSLLRAIEDVGRDPLRGGYTRPVHSVAEHELREWFLDEAARRQLDVTTDRNGVLWAWWNPTQLPLRNAVVTGSHLDSVPGGGAYDGPLGVASPLAAVSLLQQRALTPSRPLAIAVFPEEEGSRFGVACLGSRLMTGVLPAQDALRLTDADGKTFAEVSGQNGFRPEFIGRDEETLSRIGEFIELHVEQGRGLVNLDSAVAVGSSVLGHGRWRVQLRGQGNHAGTTLMSDRADPVVAAARLITDIRDLARQVPGARATVGRLVPVPGGTNVIASRLDFWLDVRHEDDATTRELVEDIRRQAATVASAEGCDVEVDRESFSPTARFDEKLSGELVRHLSVPGGPSTLGSYDNIPVLPTGAGHDAGILSEYTRTAMLFVRNPSGISHSPEEFVEDQDAVAGVHALAHLLQERLQLTDVP